MALRRFASTQARPNATGQQLFGNMERCMRQQDVVGAWGWYKQLTERRSCEQPHHHDSLLFTQSGRSQRDLVSARAYVCEAHSRIASMLSVKHIHGYSAAHLEQLTRWARLFLRESASDGWILSSKQLCGLLNLFAVLRNGDAADQIWQHATLSGAALDITNYNSYINACIRASNFDRAFEIVREVRQRGVVPNTMTQALLVRLYGVTGDLESARREFANACRVTRTPSLFGMPGCDPLRTRYWQATAGDQRINGANIYVCNEMLVVLGRNGLMDEMRQLLVRILGLDHSTSLLDTGDHDLRQAMRKRGLRPSLNTFHALIEWHAVYWDMDRAVDYVHLMRRCGVAPTPKTLRLLVTPVTAERDFQRCAEITVMMHERYRVQIPQSTMRIIEKAKTRAQEMEEQIRAAEAQPSLFSSLTGLGTPETARK
ncbi:hypothetical protein LPJ63_000982 [Coemansia sp. RSA 2711]|nr:hypothetical protein LPJ63_000982 [Coemansia sp. RSA 2711]KAJ1848624.1 hypothetical protein LPJ70_000934 [Coemansia sp. RSA 2708]KAJ2392561.1 hypothetical protein H4S02_000711 [Coemansia sp. RSA 2611]